MSDFVRLEDDNTEILKRVQDDTCNIQLIERKFGANFRQRRVADSLHVQ